MVFSIIVPFLNESRHIQKCITSLSHQDFNPDEFELIFVDNGSKDGSDKIVASYPQISLVTKTDIQNPYAARNLGITHAKGDIIAFTDADCEIAPSWLSSLFRTMNNDTTSFVIGKKSFPVTNDPFLSIYDDHQNSKIDFIIEKKMSSCFFADAGNFAIRASVLKKIGVFDESLPHADAELLHRFLKSCPDQKMAFIPERRMVVHQEIASSWPWLAKLFKYGKGNASFNKNPVGPVEMTINEKIQLFKYYIKKNNYSYLKTILAFTAMVFAYIAYTSGYISGRLEKQKTNT